MSKKRRWLAMLSVASLFIAVGGCSDDDDMIPNQQVSADIAAELVDEVVPFVLEFSGDIADLVEMIYIDKSGGWNKQATCVPIPGLESEYFCEDPANGEVCTEDEVNSELVFTDCNETSPEGGMLDGTVTVMAGGSSFDLVFALDVDDGSISGSLGVILDDPCATLTYTGFEIEEAGGSNTLNETITVCPETANGTLDVTVDAPGIQRFLMEINFDTGAITILSPTTQERLYTCFYYPGSGSYCMPYGEF